MIDTRPASLDDWLATALELAVEPMVELLFKLVPEGVFEQAIARIVGNPPAAADNPLHAQLAALPPLALPQPVSWWPPAPAWWLCATLLLVLCAIGARYTLRRRRRRAAIDDLLAQLNSYYAAWQQQGDTQRYLYNANALLRRCCNYYFPERTSPALRGQAWLAQLDALVAEPCLQSSVGQQLLLHYQLEPQADIASLQQALQAWIVQLEFHPPRRSAPYAAGERGAA